MCRKTTSLILLVLLLGLGVASADIKSDLLGYWALDGNGDDSSGNGYHGESFGDPAYVDGVMGQAMECLGDQSIYIENFDGIVGVPAVTISMWVLPYRNSGDDQVMWFNDEDGSYGRVRFGINGDEWEFKHGNGSSNPSPDDSENPIILNEWAHLVGIRENGVKLELFVNGVSVDEQDFGDAGVAEPQVSIGAERRSSSSVRTPFEGLIDEVRIYTRAFTTADVQELMEYRGLPPVRARSPQPDDASNDMPRDGLVLSWVPGDYAATHDVYVGITFADVNDAGPGSDLLISEGQDANSLALGRLELETTYYWRVDEVNGAPDNTVFKGHVWQFEVEPTAVPVAPVAATASSSMAGMGPENTINLSGLDLDEGTHSTQSTDMWVSSKDQDPTEPVSILYEFETVCKLHDMMIWNSNQAMEVVLGYGLKEMIVTYSIDGVEWTRLGGEEGLVELDMAPGDTGYSGQLVGLDDATAKYLRLTAVSNFSEFFDQYSLSEVQFSALPMTARLPNPDSGTENVDPRTAVLSWRSGRLAGQHDVFVSTDPDALGDAQTLLDNSLALDTLNLSLDTTYYWQVNEVNDSLVPSTWAGDLWSFTTLSTFVVDDFESYGNVSPDRPFQVWLDGYGYSADEFFPAGYGGNGTGAGIGHDIWSLNSPYYDGDIMEKDSTIEGSSQSMPFYYTNSGGVASETQRTFAVPQDWTVNGLQTLSIAFRGTPGNTGTLYVKINNTKITYDLSASDIALSAWQAWNIDLTSVNGDLSSVTSLGLGVDGTSAAGMILFDDIRLYAQPGEMITPEAPSSAGLLAQYTFEGNANDSSGNGLHGTLASSQIASPGTGGQGSAVQLTPGTYVDLGNPSALDFGTGDWTITAWFKTGITGTGDANKGTILGKGGDSSGGHRFALIMSETNEGSVSLVCDDNATKEQAHSQTLTNDGQWHCVTGQREGTEIRIFIDGQLEATADVAADYNLSGTSQHNAYIGAITDNSSGTRYKLLEGSVDDVTIYDRALSAGEILWLAGRTTPFHKPF